jgi:hypothetical protein
MVFEVAGAFADAVRRRRQFADQIVEIHASSPQRSIDVDVWQHVCAAIDSFSGRARQLLGSHHGGVFSLGHYALTAASKR